MTNELPAAVQEALKARTKPASEPEAPAPSRFLEWRGMVKLAASPAAAPVAPKVCKVAACEDGWVYGDGGAARCPECARRDQARRLAARYAAAGLPDILQARAFPDDARRLGLDAVELTEPYWREAHNYAKTVRDVVSDCLNLIFLGPPGTGKSQAGALIVRAAARAGLAPLAVSVPDWLSKVMHDYRRDGDTEFEHISQLAKADLLMLDDVGAEGYKDDAFTARMLGRVITKRYDLMRPTLITTNLTASATDNALLDLLGDRAYERVFFSARRLVFDGKNYRAEVEASRVAHLIEAGKAAR